MDLFALIPVSYQASRERFRGDLGLVRSCWPTATHASHPLNEHPDLSIDWIQADAAQQWERLFILTTAEHGIEGYVGSAVLQLFCAEFLPRLDPARVGVLLVHALNPWGMEHRARVNSSNVDLNRSFVDDPGELDPSFNPDYIRLGYLLNPRGPVRSPQRSSATFAAQWARALLTFGEKRVERATLLGQYAVPRGVHFGGQVPQEETRVLQELVRRRSAGYPQVVWVDVHTGYGPRQRMTLVLSAAERASTADLRLRLDYPALAKADGAEFYAMRGDMVDCSYRVFERERPDARFFALAFEFGTFGEGHWARLRGLRATVLENQLRHNGAITPQAERWVRREFSELFLPSESEWYVRAMADTRQAFAGILADGGFLSRS